MGAADDVVVVCRIEKAQRQLYARRYGSGSIDQPTGKAAIGAQTAMTKPERPENAMVDVLESGGDGCRRVDGTVPNVDGWGRAQKGGPKSTTLQSRPGRVRRDAADNKGKGRRDKGGRGRKLMRKASVFSTCKRDKFGQRDAGPQAKKQPGTAESQQVGPGSGTF
ncbi:hypothetical protein N658DRAFT_104831 [Parathielavia hyrcaniae]|uniref:Uncharacterized protein n=1 Tax=Parathielavia hyrcaniae TaxID=113614 RepID=A0AAN6T155_9PEZI|nr:hypothetical protein N658DRAFT_104831 [Parathielavia hyrcaniae]